MSVKIPEEGTASLPDNSKESRIQQGRKNMKTVTA